MNKTIVFILIFVDHDGANIFHYTNGRFIATVEKAVKIVKAGGGALIVLVTIGCIVSLIQLAIPQQSDLRNRPCNCSIVQISHDLDRNTSFCYIVHRYPLTEELYISVCTRKNTTYLKFEKYVKDSKDLVDLDITTYQWLFLKRSAAHIDKSIHEAERLKPISTRQMS